MDPGIDPLGEAAAGQLAHAVSKDRKWAQVTVELFERDHLVRERDHVPWNAPSLFISLFPGGKGNDYVPGLDGGLMPRDASLRAKRAVLIFFTAWAVVVLIVPWTLPASSVPDLSGRSGSLDNMDSIEEMNPLAAAVYIIGDVYCHQKLDRSFTMNGNEMPFCARDVGIFLGLAMGMLLIMVLRPRFHLLLFIALVVPILLDGGMQYLGAYESNNVVRIITGGLGGAGSSYFLGHVADKKLGSSTDS